VYLFSPTGFSRVAQGAFGPESQEWSCPAPVRPLAYLRVAGEDFPLLDKIHGHDDSRTQQFLALRNNLFRECEEAIPIQDGYILRYFQRPRLEEDLFELSKILRHAYPWINLKLNMPPSPGKFELHLSGAGGLRDVLDNQLNSKVKKDFSDREYRFAPIGEIKKT